MDMLMAIKELWGVDFPALVVNYKSPGSQRGGTSRDDAIIIDE